MVNKKEKSPGLGVYPVRARDKGSSQRDMMTKTTITKKEKSHSEGGGGGEAKPFVFVWEEKAMS